MYSLLTNFHKSCQLSLAKVNTVNVSSTTIRVIIFFLPTLQEAQTTEHSRLRYSFLPFSDIHSKGKGDPVFTELKVDVSYNADLREKVINQKFLELIHNVTYGPESSC